MSKNLRIAVVGGGLGGLATARALSERGFRCDVFERAGILTEIGAGINVSPQATRALIALGLGEQAIARANVSKGIFTRDMHTGEEIAYMDMRGAEEKYGAPFLTFHRADLIELLSASLDPATIHLKHTLSGLEENGDEVVLRFANGVTHAADIVIGADGVHSVVRQAIYGDQKPTYTGQMVWRAMVDGRDVPADLLDPSGHIRWVGPGRHFFGYYLRGREVINIVTQEDTDEWVGESWNAAGDVDDMKASFPDPEPRLATLLAAVRDCSKWGLFTRPLTHDWGRGRIQLIGDAAHAMLPNAGQGACQAFEDAYILSRWLDAEADPVEAFERFREVRIPRVHAVQTRAAANARMFHMKDADARNQQLKSAEVKGGAINWIYDFDPVKEWNRIPEPQSVG